LCSAIHLAHYFVLRIGGETAIGARQESFGESVLSSLQSGARNRTQVRRSLYVRADGGNQAAAEIDGAADLFLPAVFCVPGDGTSARGSFKRRSLENDSRVGLRRPSIERCGVGNAARDRRIIACYWNRRQPAYDQRRWILRVLNAVDLCRSIRGGRHLRLRFLILCQLEIP
jgi:hypothetical protein